MHITTTSDIACEPKPSEQSVAVGEPERLYSLDALRGFDMFWIIGGGALVSAIAKKFDVSWLSSVTNNLTEHVEWEGFHFFDLIFPLFLFIMGVAIPFSLDRRRMAGATLASLGFVVARRTILMFLIGWIYSGLLQFKGFDELRIMGVLQRLALGYGFAAGISLIWTTSKARIIWVAGLLIGYYVLLKFGPVPGFAPGEYSPQGNFANYVDRLILSPKQMYEPFGDPEGFLSTIPAVATALLGVLTGTYLRSQLRSGTQKAFHMSIAGVVLISLGYAWSMDMPIIKKIWTSSYALVAAGWSLLLLSGFYYVIDVLKVRAWAFFFAVIGMNAITIYLGQRIINFDHTTRFFLGGTLELFPSYAPIIVPLGVLGMKWIVLYFLHRKQTYLRL